MKRSILLSVMFIGGILAVLGFSAASFYSSVSTDETLTVGTLDSERIHGLHLHPNRHRLERRRRIVTGQ